MTQRPPHVSWSSFLVDCLCFNYFDLACGGFLQRPNFKSLHSLRVRLSNILPHSLRPRRLHEEPEKESLYQQSLKSDASVLQQRRWVFVHDERDFNLLGFDENEQNSRGDLISGPENIQQLRISPPENLRGGTQRPISIHSDRLQELEQSPSGGQGIRRTGGKLRGGNGDARYESGPR